MQNIPFCSDPNVFLIPKNHGNNHCNKFWLQQTFVQNENNEHYNGHP